MFRNRGSNWNGMSIEINCLHSRFKLEEVANLIPQCLTFYSGGNFEANIAFIVILANREGDGFCMGKYVEGELVSHC